MNENTAIELLKIAAGLTNTAISGSRQTGKQQGTSVKAPIETVFDDCLKAVLAQHHDLTHCTD